MHDALDFRYLKHRSAGATGKLNLLFGYCIAAIMGFLCFYLKHLEIPVGKMGVVLICLLIRYARR